MKSIVAACAAVALSLGPAAAQEVADTVSAWAEDREQVFEAGDISLDAFRWVARPIVIFADSPFDPAFQEQMELIESRFAELAERDVIVIADSDPAARSDLRETLRPRGFMLVLIGKDGQIKLRKPAPWDVRELSRSIDKMPLRRQEIRSGGN